MAKKKVVKKVAKKIRKKRSLSKAPAKTGKLKGPVKQVTRKTVTKKKKATKKKTPVNTFSRRTCIKGGSLVIEEDGDGGARIRWYLPPRGTAQAGMLGFSVGIPRSDLDEMGVHVGFVTTFTEVTEVLSRVRSKDKSGGD